MRETGRVKWFSADKGYGFIRRDQGGEVFVHASAVDVKHRPLGEGDAVEFETVSTPKGTSAKSVAKI